MTMNCTPVGNDFFIKPNITNYTDMFEYANCVTSSFFGEGIVWIVFIVVFGTTLTRSPSVMKSIMTSAFISWVVAIMMHLLNFVSTNSVVIFFFITVISATLVFAEGKEPYG